MICLPSCLPTEGFTRLGPCSPEGRIFPLGWGQETPRPGITATRRATCHHPRVRHLLWWQRPHRSPQGPRCKGQWESASGCGHPSPLSWHPLFLSLAPRPLLGCSSVAISPTCHDLTASPGDSREHSLKKSQPHGLSQGPAPPVHSRAGAGAPGLHPQLQILTRPVAVWPGLAVSHCIKLRACLGWGVLVLNSGCPGQTRGVVLLHGPPEPPL